MTEDQEARVLANKILDRVNADPDDDLAVLSRQLLRADERILRLRAYRQWLRDSFRVIAEGKHEAAKADHYVTYARDTLSGPTGQSLQGLMKVIAEAEGGDQ